MASVKCPEVNSKPSGNAPKGKSSSTPTRRANAPSSSSSSKRSHCRCQLIKEFRFDCGHTEFLRGGPQPYCLLSGFCAEVGDVRELPYLAGPRCLQCHARAQYLAAHPGASRSALKSEARRAAKESRLVQEQKACEQLLATSRAKTKPFLDKKRRAHVIDRAAKALRHLLLYKYRRVGGPLPHDGEILYRVAAEVLAICRRLGHPDADRLVDMFGQLVTAYDEKWAKHLKRYVRACDGEDGRLSAVYDEAFRVQQPKSFAIRKRRERQTAAREQRRNLQSQADKQKEEPGNSPGEVVDDTLCVPDEEVNPEVLGVGCEHETNPDVVIPEPEGEPEFASEEQAPETPPTPEQPAIPTLFDGQKPVGNWADECEELDGWN